MGKEYLKADKKDYEELVDFINYVFSHSGGKTDFPSLLPKVYKNKDKIKYHHIIKVDKRIKGVVGAFPLTLSLLDEKSKCYRNWKCIGSSLFKGTRLYERTYE